MGDWWHGAGETLWGVALIASFVAVPAAIGYGLSQLGLPIVPAVALAFAATMCACWLLLWELTRER